MNSHVTPRLKMRKIVDHCISYSVVIKVEFLSFFDFIAQITAEGRESKNNEGLFQ